MRRNASALKQCAECGFHKPKNDFRKAGGNQDGLSFFCRRCERIAREQVIANLERGKKVDKEVI